MPTHNNQPYRFGWVFACVTLAGAYPNLPVLGTVLGLFVAAWSLVAGLAAAFVKPWGWYVLMLSYPFSLAYVPLYFVFATAIPLAHKLIFLVSTLAFATFGTAYFYKRRAAFGAKWRWRTAERWCPQLVGPDVYTGGARPGFLQLSWSRRFLVVAVILVLLGLSWAGTP